MTPLPSPGGELSRAQAAADFSSLPKAALFSHREEGLREAGYAGYAGFSDLNYSSEEDLQQAHPEINRLRRYLS